MPSTEKLTLVLPFTIGPWLFTCQRFTCSGARSSAKALVPFIDSSRKPKLARLRQLPIPGWVITSTRTMPASWYSAA